MVKRKYKPFKIPPDLLALCRQLHEAQKRAKKLGIFVHDRDLLACPKCGLEEDIAFEGHLMTIRRPKFDETGLRFRALDSKDRKFSCPSCGTKKLRRIKL